MLGTGTQLDPYQITTVAEFRAMNDSNAYFKLMNDLDVNDSEWASGWGSVTLRFKEFDGDGHEIRNIVTSQEKSITIFVPTANETKGRTKNLKLLNCIANHNYFIQREGSYDYYFINFTNCQMSITGVNVAYILHRVKLRESGLSLSGMNCTAANLSTVNGLHLERCRVMLDLDNSGTTSTIFDNVQKTAITGKLKAPANLALSRNWSNSYFACEVSVGNVSQVSSNASTGINFVDKDLLTQTTNVGRAYNLTTAQCKDKDYLNSIGFLVV